MDEMKFEMSSFNRRCFSNGVQNLIGSTCVICAIKDPRI